MAGPTAHDDLPQPPGRRTAAARRRPVARRLLDAEQGQRLAGFAQRLRDLADAHTTRRDFWRHTVDQYGLISELTTALVLAGIRGQAPALALAGKLFEVIRATRR